MFGKYFQIINILHFINNKMKVKDCEKSSKFEIEWVDTEWKIICKFKFEISRNNSISPALTHQN